MSVGAFRIVYLPLQCFVFTFKMKTISFLVEQRCLISLLVSLLSMVIELLNKQLKNFNYTKI